MTKTTLESVSADIHLSRLRRGYIVALCLTATLVVFGCIYMQNSLHTFHDFRDSFNSTESNSESNVEVNAANFNRINASKVARLKVTGSVIAGVVLAVLLLGAWLFEPLVRAVQRQIQLLEEQNATLVAARNQAEEATRFKSRFLANMGHEIRTPMNGILGVTELSLRSSELPQQHREQIKMIQSSATNLLRLLNDLLDLSKVEAGALELEEAPFQLADCLDGSVGLFAQQAADKGLQLTTNVDEKIPDVLVGDRHRLQQVIMNLVSNALKFTATGSVAVDATLDQEQDGRARLLISVQDSGIGIPREDQLHIFDAFRQVDSATTRQFGGTGLGLAVCDELVRALSGKIWVESEPGAGATFRFTAELGVGAVEDLKAAASADEPANEQTEPARQLKILVADDDVVNRKVVCGLLDRRGHQVQSVVNGREALEAIQESRFDILLMDVHMPEMDGLTASRRIRELAEPLNQIPIIGITASCLRDDHQDCLTAGMDQVLTKPTKPDYLIDVVEEFANQNADHATSRLNAPSSVR